jgi:signal transduction histidine kinase
MVNLDSINESILIVDDEEHVRTILQRILQNEGYPCATAESSEKALDYLKDNPCSLMLVDVHMPGINGLDLLQTCRRQWPDTQVVMCSGDNMEETVLKTLEAGAIGYLIKPFERVEVLFNVKNALRLSHLEKENRSQRLQLEQKLEQCNLDLHESYRRMVQQERLASLGQLAAGVAHEVNNPTGYIASNLSSLQKYLKRIRTFHETAQALIDAGSDSRLHDELHNLRIHLKIDDIMADLEELVTDAIEGTERIRRIVMGLKKFSHKEAEEAQAIDVNKIIEETLSLCWNELKYKTEVKRRFSPLPQIWGMPQKLSQVFLNLLVNAAQAIEKQGTITIITQQVGDEIQIAISDDGCGIAEEQLDKIFEPFYTTKGETGGTGLGLSILHEIIGQHHGRVHVQSKPGAGSTFTVILPVFSP